MLIESVIYPKAIQQQFTNKKQQQMQKKPIAQKQKIVQLKQLVSQPQCLKLLILHTPFTLNLQSLPQCVNLVKLDLSKNNLTTFPYLGDLPNLRFMFIHENKLDIEVLIGIFQESMGEQDGDSRSVLSRGILWVTFWGNRNQFAARHYLVNHTSVLAVDHHMVVPEEKNQYITVNKHYVQPFSPITDVTSILQNRKKFNKNATEEQYMTQFWQDMAQIRKKHIKINPVLMIQKVYRGWIYRTKQQRLKSIKKKNKAILQIYFKNWKSVSRFEKKLTKILKKKNKQHLLLPLKQMRLIAFKKKLIQFAGQCKRKILLRKMNLKAQYVFFNALRSNQLALKSLYHALHLQRSNYLVIHIEGVEQFTKYVLPVAKLINEGKQITIQNNQNIQLRSLYQPSRKRRQFIRLLQLNEKSIIIIQNKKDPLQKKKTINQKLMGGLQNVTKVYDQKNIHFSTRQIQSMKILQKSFQTKLSINLTQLKKITPLVDNIDQKVRILKDLIRGVYFYNMGYLTNNVVPTEKINILSQYSIKRISAIIKIQKIWRGKILRRKIKQLIKSNMILQRATIKIQRWYRNWKWSHRKLFMFNMLKTLRTFNGESFYIKMKDYKLLISERFGQDYYDMYRVKFIQQHIQPFIHKQSKKIVLSWNHQSNNQGCSINYRINKKLFTTYFLSKVFQNSQQNFPSPIKYQDQKAYQRCQISHLFHYKTQIALLNKKNELYLEVKCASKFDSRLRILGLNLFSYKFNKKTNLQIYNKENLLIHQIQQNLKKPIRNNNSVFLTQCSSGLQIQPMISQTATTFLVPSKFYINVQNDQKPVKYNTILRIIMFKSEQREVPQLKIQKTKQLRSVTQNNGQKFDISNFLFLDPSEIKLDQATRQNKLNDQLTNVKPYIKKNSLKDIKVQKRLKLKNRQKIKSQFYRHGDKKFNFMLGDPSNNERLTTQPDLYTHERSMGSIIMDSANNKTQDNNLRQSVGKSQNTNYKQKKSFDQRVQVRKRISQQGKSGLKYLDQFTKNFVNQGNFIQNQYLYGQIKRLKTEIQRNSNNQVTRIKTEQDQRGKNIERFNEQKIKKVQYSNQKYKQQIFRSMIQKRLQSQTKQKRRKIDLKQLNYKSLPKKMRINFAEQCYPIIGKHPYNMNQK